MNHPTITDLRHAITEGDTAFAMECAARLERELAPVTERQVLYARDALEQCFGKFLTNDLSSLDGDEPPEALLHETFRFVRDLRSIFRALERRLLQTDSLIVPRTATYDRALEVVRDFTEGLSTGNAEYERGQLELLADLFGGPEADTGARIERISAAIRALPVPTGETN